ncbi:hypothetical protein [Metapseudomonas otitidis]|uniref:hypothetical protein n=1 Tax=Metapseudomonas otitidis TaxID=319939 RepID=UPI0028115B07|nr:hypothetical protein [Pseudomonas otitidis]WMR32679.1 hypothetical protein QT513_26580 [Pseudomonas otitidis]
MSSRKPKSRTRLPSKQKQPTRMQVFCKKYEDFVLLPYFVWFLNAFGMGGVDRLISKHANDYALERLERLIEELQRKIDSNLLQPGSEEFVAALHQSINALMETTSTEKAKLFAVVLADTWNSANASWTEVSQTLKLIRELEDVHIMLLREALKVHNTLGPQATFTVSKRYPRSTPIDLRLPNVSTELLELCVSDLIAKGLINDSFVDNEAMSTAERFASMRPGRLVYCISELGIWFLQRLHETTSEPATALATH